MSDRIEREVLVVAEPDDVWQVVTSPGWLAEEVEIELVPGGGASFRAGGRAWEGWVEEARPPERLAFWWSSDGEPASRVEIRLERLDEGTRVRVSETRPLEVLDIVGIPLPGPGGAQRGPAMLALA